MPGEIARAGPQDREALVDGFDLPRAVVVRAARGLQVGAEIEVLRDRETGEDLPPFRHVGEPAAHPSGDGHGRRRTAVEHDFAGERRQEA